MIKEVIMRASSVGDIGNSLLDAHETVAIGGLTITTPARFLEMHEAIELLVEFGDGYSLASQSGGDHDPNGELVESVQVLLALLTNTTASPVDVEAVLPFDAVLTDA